MSHIPNAKAGDSGILDATLVFQAARLVLRPRSPTARCARRRDVSSNENGPVGHRGGGRLKAPRPHPPAGSASSSQNPSSPLADQASGPLLSSDGAVRLPKHMILPTVCSLQGTQRSDQKDPKGATPLDRRSGN